MIDTLHYVPTSVLNETNYEISADSRQRFLIENDNDILFFKSLEFFLSTPEISLGEFKKNLRDSSFIYEINGEEVYSIPLKILIELSSKKIGDKIVVKLPHNVLREIMLYKLSNLPIVFRIEDKNREFINKVTKFCLTFRTMKVNEERKRIESHINKPITFQKINREYHLFVETNTMKTTVADIKSRGLIKGFLVHANLYDLVHLKFYINDEIYLDYDIFDINNLCHMIKNELIFFSLSQNIINENGIQTTLDFMDLSNVRNMKLVLNFTNPQENILIYAVQKGLLKYISNNILIELNPQNIMTSLLTA